MLSNFHDVNPVWMQSIYARVRFARTWGAVMAVAAALVLTACGGGGGDDGNGYASINVGVNVGGQPSRAVVVRQGGGFDLALRAGDAVTLVAGEPVVWTLFVGGAAVGTGVEVFYAGVNMIATRLDAYAVGLETFANFRLTAPVAVTLVATSPYDSAQVAAVNILITN